MQFLRSNWRRTDDLADMRQDIYLRVFEAAKERIPKPAKPFLFTVARNILIDRYRRERIIPIEGVADLELYRHRVYRAGSRSSRNRPRRTTPLAGCP